MTNTIISNSSIHKDMYSVFWVKPYNKKLKQNALVQFINFPCKLEQMTCKMTCEMSLKALFVTKKQDTES